MTQLSVNINKVATIRNARGGDLPDVILFAKKSEIYGADGITVHPRPDERHITYQDVRDVKENINIEFNVEGYPSKDFLNLVLEVLPDQVTLVPDPPDVITSNSGWDIKNNFDFLKDVIGQLRQAGIRTSVFVSTDLVQIEYASKIMTDRIELYTEDYSKNYKINPNQAISAYLKAASLANKFNLGINAGHDLNLDNLKFFADKIPSLLEVSIGHALISDALYLGLENTIQIYKRQLS